MNVKAAMIMETIGAISSHNSTKRGGFSVSYLFRLVNVYLYLLISY